MVTKGIIRWSPFFVGLDDEEIASIARVSTQTELSTGECLFVEGEELDTFYLIQKGTIHLTMDIPSSQTKHRFADQLTRNIETEPLVLSTIQEGNIFGWSAIIPPHISTANAVAATDCLVLAVKFRDLKPVLENDYEFAYKLVLIAAQTIRSRLRQCRMEWLAFK